MLLGLPPLVPIVVLGGMKGEVVGTVQFLLAFLGVDGVHRGNLGLFAEGLRAIVLHTWLKSLMEV